MLYDENHHIQKLMLHDKSGSHKADPTKEMHVSEGQQKQETKHQMNQLDPHPITDLINGEKLNLYDPLTIGSPTF